MRRLSSYVGLIVGPAWAGSTVRYPYVFLGVPIAILALNAVSREFFLTLAPIINKKYSYYSGLANSFSYTVYVHAEFPKFTKNGQKRRRGECGARRWRISFFAK